MLTLNDGRKELYQWDSGRMATVDVECDVVHFSNLKYGESLAVEVKAGEVSIPNKLLMSGAPIYCWAFVKDESGAYTKKEQTLFVTKRAKPSDYLYTETEVVSVKNAVKQGLEEAKSSGEFDGEKGDKGDKGDRGEQGIQGEKGDKGEPAVTDQSYNPESENAQSGIAVAEALRTFDKKYELIETIKLTEDVTQISRKSEPDGKDYNFKKLFIDYKGAKSMSRVRTNGKYKYGNVTGVFNCYVVANHTMGYIEIDASDILKYYGAGGTSTAYTVQCCTTGPYAKISKADTITSLLIEGTNSLYAGTVINIYGVRA